MPLTPEEERRVEELLARAAEEGRRAGRSEALRGVLASRARRLLREDYRAAGEVLGGFQRLADGLYHMATRFFSGSTARYRDGMRPAVNDAAEAATEPAAEILGRFDVRRPNTNDFLESYVSELADRLSETTYRQTMRVMREANEEGLSVQDAARRLREKAGIETERRANLIARNELQRIAKGASWAQAKESGVIRGKKRVEQDDERTRESHRLLDGEERAIGEPYSNGEMWAGQRDINCRGYDDFLIDWEALEERGPEPPAPDPDLPEPEELGDPHDEVAPFFEDPDLEITGEEAERIAGRISWRAARRGYDAEARVRAGKEIAEKGLQWEGRTRSSGETLPSDVKHFLKHVVALEEWPGGTDLEGYLRSVRDVIEDPETGVYVNRFGPRRREQVGFVRRAKGLAGPKSGGWVLVEYVLETGHVHTAFQPDRGYGYIFEDREIVRWLRRPEGEPE